MKRPKLGIGAQLETFRRGSWQSAAAVGCLLGCTCNAPPQSEPESVRATSPSASVQAAAVEPLLLLTTEGSAYHARLYADASSFYLLTERDAFHLSPGQPVERIPLPPGAESTWSSQGYVKWLDGNLEFRDLRTGAATRKHRLAEQPRALTAWRDSVGWLASSKDGASLVGSDASRQPVFRSAGNIESLTMLSDWLFFVERLEDRLWRIGAVPAAGGTPRFTAARDGRAPALLARDEEALYYYEGKTREVRRLAPDLQSETVVGRGVCSPLAVSGSVFCSRVEGIFELPPDEPVRQLAVGGLQRMATDLAATPGHVAWLSEAGSERLEVWTMARR